MGGEHRLDEVAAAVDRGAWQVALELLDGDADGATTAAGWELRARAAYGNGEFEACVSAWEELHALLVRQSRHADAARAAAMIAMYIMMDTGLMAPVRGWLRRAERLLEGHDESQAHALIAMVRAYERLMCGDMEAVRQQAAESIELGTRHGVEPAVIIGRVAAARVRIFDGDVAEGLELLDEVGTHLMSGAADPLTTGMMYCELICAAQGLALYDRASEWTNVMEHWRHGAAFGGINGRCRVHRAEMLRTSGPCDLAEAEALRACDELRPWMRREFGWPLVELGNIRLRKGDLEGAEEAYCAAHDHAWSPQPGLALVRLAQGDVAAASALVADAIAHPFEIPSKERPPFGDLRLAPLIDAQSEIAVAAGDSDTARRAAATLRSIADTYPSRSLRAMADLAAGRSALLDDDLEAAIDCCTAAIAGWTDIGAPFEAAVARTVLGEACHRSGHVDGARMEWRSAQAAFEEFGAALWAHRAAHLAEGLCSDVSAALRDPTAAGSGGSSASTGSAGGSAVAIRTATFRCDGDTRTVEFGGATAVVRDLKGLRYVERLLGDPGREFHVLDLVAVEQGSLPVPRAGRGISPAISGDISELRMSDGSGLPLIDDHAREAYRRRLAEVDDDIDEAVRLNDTGRIELAQRDREYLIAELTSAVGLGGRNRMVGGDAERARSSVTRSIRYGLERLAAHHPAIARHLHQNVHTGIYCVYAPDPLAPVEWLL
jgi:tetratricopeptide (TPR) repeat protein